MSDMQAAFVAARAQARPAATTSSWHGMHTRLRDAMSYALSSRPRNEVLFASEEMLGAIRARAAADEAFLLVRENVEAARVRWEADLARL